MNHKSYSSALLPWNGIGSRVAVVGDIILDEYLHGTVDRISPEAPVPVHLITKITYSPGGAANVARNIHRCGGHVTLIGALGIDDAATKLKEIFSNEQLPMNGLVKDAVRPTIKKTRVTAGTQQIVRIDREETSDLSPEISDKILSKVSDTDFEVLILSDYGKGTLHQELSRKIIKLAASKGKKVIVDPKGKDYSRYEGVYLVTPNRKEACEALNLDHRLEWDSEQLAKGILDKYKVQNVLLTLGAEGMYLLGSTQKHGIRIPAKARRVFDVSGAGDTVVGVTALGLMSNMKLIDAAQYANLAAGIVVEKWGTQPIEEEELKLALHLRAQDHELRQDSLTNKLMTVDQLLGIFGEKSKRRQKIVFTNGCFDIFHAGHASYLEECKTNGDILVVAVNSDDSVRRLKGESRPIVSLENRLKVLAAMGSVDFLLVFDDDTPEALIKKLIPDVLMKASDYSIDRIVGAQWVQENGGRVATAELKAGISTSIIIDKIFATKKAK